MIFLNTHDIKGFKYSEVLGHLQEALETKKVGEEWSLGLKNRVQNN